MPRWRPWYRISDERLSRRHKKYIGDTERTGERFLVLFCTQWRHDGSSCRPPASRAAGNIVILKTRLTLNEVIEQVGLEYTYEELRDMISATSINSTGIFEITVTSPDPAEAERVANTIVQVLPEKISGIVDGSSARTVDFAVQPTRKSSPNVTRNVAVGCVIGMILSCVAITVLELLDEKIRDEEYLMQTYHLPVLAAVPDLIKSGGSVPYGREREEES